MTYIDAHCHLADSRFDCDRDQVMDRALAAGITRFIQGGVDPQDWARQRQYADQRWICAYGLHPWFIAAASEQACETAFDQLKQQIADVPLLGELGLDYSRRCPAASRDRQRRYFSAQLELARVMNKGVVLHIVAAYGAAIEILQPFAPLAGIVHGFSGSKDVLRQLLDLGLLISVGGAITRPGFKKLKEALAYIPEDRLVVESDAPDMAPAAYDRPFNEPESLPMVAATIARLRDTRPETILARSTQNLIRALHLEPLP